MNEKAFKEGVKLGKKALEESRKEAISEDEI
jgi:hypothetical protein